MLPPVVLIICVCACTTSTQFTTKQDKRHLVSLQWHVICFINDLVVASSECGGASSHSPFFKDQINEIMNQLASNTIPKHKHFNVCIHFLHT